jgi:tRNA nucleotidyltransferase (CCA-adding enzyme)
MLNSALSLLKLIEKAGFKAYIVGGFARDLYLDRKSVDIDITTNATPKDLQIIFPSSAISKDRYGSVSLTHKKIRFEITTFRKELKYENHRQPVKIKYINNLKEDLLRRDFTINTLCIDVDGNILDLLNAKEDLDNKIIKVVGNSKRKIKEDALRILRAIRFATILDFQLDPILKKHIKKYGYLVNKLSNYRKKEELDKILSSPNSKYGINLLTELDLLKHLDIHNLNNIVITNSILGIWAQLDYIKYNFNAHEKEMIEDIKSILDKDILDKNILYKYGLYVCEVAGEVKGINYKNIVKNYNSLQIHSIQDINIKAEEITKLLDKTYGPYLKDIYKDLEYVLINDVILNDNNVLKEYILKNYKTNN